jgi:hypothetical protein
MIKPEFCSDGKLGKLSRDARLLFILLWMHSDDYGVISGSERFLLGNCFENDESVTNSMLKKWIVELTELVFLIAFEADYKLWYKITNWEKHQKVDKPSKRRNPVFEGKTPELKESGDPLETLATGSEIPEDERERERERERVFVGWWDIYNKKVGDKKKVLAKFNKLSEADIEIIKVHTPLYVKSTPEAQYRKHPMTYINDRHFMSEDLKPTEGVSLAHAPDGDDVEKRRLADAAKVKQMEEAGMFNNTPPAR